MFYLVYFCPEFIKKNFIVYIVFFPNIIKISSCIRHWEVLSIISKKSMREGEKGG